MAWTLGKPMIAYQDDVRSMIAGRMNPLLVGTVDFTSVQHIHEIPAALHAECLKFPPRKFDLEHLPKRVRTAVARGPNSGTPCESATARIGSSPNALRLCSHREPREHRPITTREEAFRSPHERVAVDQRSELIPYPADRRCHLIL